MRKFIDGLDLQRITLVCQDWGGLLGLRVLSQIPERFARVVAMNTGLPSGEPPSPAFIGWRRFSQSKPYLECGQLLARAASSVGLSDAERAAYDAPFPGSEYQAGALAFPTRVPLRPDELGAYENRKASERIAGLGIPALLIWGGRDEVTPSWEPHLREILRPARETLLIESAGHFIQEEAGAEVAKEIASWLESI